MTPISFILPYRYLGDRAGRLEETCYWLACAKSHGDQVIIADQTEEGRGGRDAQCDIYIADPRAVWCRSAAINLGIISSHNEWVCPMAIDMDLSDFEEARKQMQTWMTGERLIGFLHPEPGGHVNLFPKSLWGRVGGFDERFEGWGWEDVDFARKVRAAGIEIVQSGLLLPHIPHPVTEDTYAAQEVNHQRYIEKWGDDER